MRRTTHPSVLPLVLLRLAKGVTQLEIAGRLGITAVTVSNWETGKSAMTMAHAAEYAAALGFKLNPMTFTPIAGSDPNN